MKNYVFYAKLMFNLDILRKVVIQSQNQTMNIIKHKFYGDTKNKTSFSL